MSAARIEPSAFDTELLGVRVGKAAVSGLTRELVDELGVEMERVDCDVVFIRDTAFRFERMNELPWDRLELADVKVVLSRADFQVLHGDVIGFEVGSRIAPQDLQALQSMVRDIARRSRFYRAFGEAAAFRLYDAWLENAMAGRAADWCFVAHETASGRPAGLLVIRREGESADLALVATAEAFRGRGVLRLMCAHALPCIHAAGVRRCTTATQLSNASALRAYESLGFAFDGTVVDFHLRRA
jgi:GNAT superfamily N-acetyltransferase